jgi:general secretion pathway protein B
MSYILDALRRSQAERERGKVPGLDARPGDGVALPEATAGLPWRRAALVALALGVPALVLLLWLRSPPPAVPAPPPAAEAPVRPAAPLPAAAATPEPATAPGPTALPVVVSAPVPPPAVAVMPPSRTVPAPAVAVAALPAAAGASAAPAAVPLAALSPALRRELPPLAMGGSIWSDNALSRFVIVNGQVVREGEAAAPGVVVERIGPKTVWLRWRELRLEVPL